MGTRRMGMEEDMEREKRNKRRRAWLVLSLQTLVELVLVAAVARLRGFEWGRPFALNARYLSDGLFVVGLLAGGMGLLIWVSTTGFFDIMSYGFKSLLVLFSPFRKPKDHISFYDYKMLREGKRGKTRPALLVSGVLCILLSLLFLWIYYR